MRKYNKRISFRLTDKQIDELAALALLEGRSKGAVVRRLLEQYMNHPPLRAGGVNEP